MSDATNFIFRSPAGTGSAADDEVLTSFRQLLSLDAAGSAHDAPRDPRQVPQPLRLTPRMRVGAGSVAPIDLGAYRLQVQKAADARALDRARQGPLLLRPDQRVTSLGENRAEVTALRRLVADIVRAELRGTGEERGNHELRDLIRHEVRREVHRVLRDIGGSEPR